MRRHELSDEEWSVIAPLLPTDIRGVKRVDDRRVINGILWRFRTGCSWRDVPERHGPRTTLYNRFSRWRKAGVWDRLLLDAVSKRHDSDIVMIDSSCVRVHQHGANAKRGVCRSLHGTFAWRPDDQDTRIGRRRGPPRSHGTDGWTGRRRPGCAEAALRSSARIDRPCRQGLRHRCHQRFGQAVQMLGQHPCQDQSQAVVQLQPLALSAEKPCRTLLQSHQEHARHRDTI